MESDVDIKVYEMVERNSCISLYSAEALLSSIRVEEHYYRFKVMTYFFSSTTRPFAFT